MFKLCFFLFLTMTIWAIEPAQTVSENDTSSLVEGVSVITGDLYTFDEDYVVQGAEPIPIFRSFLSREGYFRKYEHLIAQFLFRSNCLVAFEPNGTEVRYYPDSKNKVRPAIGDDFFGVKEKKRKELRYNALTRDDQGVTNTKTGEISAKSNLKNQYLCFKPNEDKKGKSFTLYAADGTIRKYINFVAQEKTDSPYGKEYELYSYKLVSETLPNGHMIHYRWDSKNNLDRIHTTNISQTKTFASIEVPVLPEKDPPPEAIWRGSDGRFFAIHSHPIEAKDRYVICKVISPDLPDQQYGWDVKDVWMDGEMKKRPHLSSYSLPKGRNLHVTYYDDSEKRVKMLRAPVGKDSNLITTHTFTYDPPGRNSFVLDAYGNKTSYSWDENYRLKQIHRFIGENTPHSSDVFEWEGSLLKSKTFLDEKGAPVFCRSYAYDPWGNVQNQTFSGHLTGNKGWESYTKKYEYSKDGKNLLLKEEGSNQLVVTYSYWFDTHLPHIKTVFEGQKSQIRYVYEYDSDHILIRETVDDGVSKKIKQISPYTSGPYLGMPETIEELYGERKLLQKVVLHYGTGALITQKDVYDSLSELRYSLKMRYDEKGRLISETNPIGQEAIYRYDDLGNKKYERDFSGKLETFYEYDFSNRLIQKEEKGADGSSRICKYAYDFKHNLTTETDPFGNQTTYVLNPFGSRKEIHHPSLETERDEWVCPVEYQTFDSASNVISKIDTEGNTTLTKYTAYNKPYEIIHPDGSAETFTYDLDGHLKTHTDAVGVTTHYTYDYLGRTLTKTIANAIEQYEYEGLVLKKKTDAEGYVTVYEYDLAGRKKSEICEREQTTYHYDELGRVEKIEKGNLVTKTRYDLLNRVIEETNESHSGRIFRKVNYEYDEAGNRTAIIRNIDGKESRETFEYDTLGRLVKKTDALGFSETWEYDTQIHQELHRDPLGLETIKTYNSLSQLSSIEKRKNGKTLFLEKKFTNQKGQLALQIDAIYGPDGQKREVRTRWEYDCRGNLKTLTEAEGTIEAKATQYAYTPRNELETIIKPNGVTLTYRYNDLGYLCSLSASDGSLNHTMKYNLLGHLQEQDGVVRETDAFGRVTEETFPQGFSIDTTFDLQGRKETCKIAEADCLVVYDYDPADLKSVTRKTLSGQSLYTHTYLKRDLAGNITQEQRIDGSPSDFKIDLLNRKFAITSLPISEEVVQFDSLGNILQKKRDGCGIIQYTYDDLYQLTSEKGQFNHTYAFDSLHNRLQKDEEAYQINALHQITSHLEYDRNGNPIHLNNTTLDYDALDRLILIKTAEFTQTFQYDALHRCLSKTTIQNGEQKTLYFLYDGENEIGSFDENGRLLELRILGEAPHAEIGAAVALELEGEICTPIHDLHGNLAALLPFDSAPTLYHYSAFGEEIIEGNTLSPWRFSSKRTDNLTHFVFFGRRFYIPSFGRWLTPDPSGFTDGMNLYAYVHNNPLTHLDDYGLFDNQQLQETLFKSYAWNQNLYKPPPLHFFGGGMNSTQAPMIYVNGMLNTRQEAFRGACTLAKTFNWKANVRSLYSETFGAINDLRSVFKSRNNPNYTSDAVRRLKRELEWNIGCLEASNDSRKIFVHCFSRGAADTYHAVKNFTDIQKDRLIINAFGPILILPRNLGFRVTNFISKGDWCSLQLHPVLEHSPNHYDRFANVVLLPQKDGFKGFNKDHFSQSKTYQEAAMLYTTRLYDKYGVSK